MRKSCVAVMLVMLAVIVLFQAGCVKTATLSEVRALSHKSATLLGGNLWYCGTDDAFHYFCFEELDGSSALKLKKADLAVGQVTPPSKQKSDWKRVQTVIMSSGRLVDGLDSL